MFQEDVTIVSFAMTAPILSVLSTVPALIFSFGAAAILATVYARSPHDVADTTTRGTTKRMIVAMRLSFL